MSEALLENSSTRSLCLRNPTIDWVYQGTSQFPFLHQENSTKGIFPSATQNPLLKNIELLKNLIQLPENWAGPNSKPFSPILIEKVFNIISNFTNQPQIFPTARNSVQIEFESGDNYLEFEIFDEKIVALIQLGGIDKEKEVSEKEVFQLTEDFYAAIAYSG
jgi:hypothetical protein